MNIGTMLSLVEKKISDSKEREYFWTHEERYRKILTTLKDIKGHSIKQAVQTSGDRVTRLMARKASGTTETHTQVSPKIRVLDVGCFPYHLGAVMEMLDMDVYGISSEHEPIRKPTIKVCNIETEKFPFKDNFFDIVIFTEVLEHLPQSPMFTLKQIYRVLKPGGRVLMTTPNIARSINRAKLLLGKSVTYPLHQILDNGGEGSNIYHRHNREYTLRECVDILKLSNFSVESADTFVSYTPFRRRAIPDSLWLKAGKITNYALMLMASGLRDTILVVGKK